jgi:hypothetical protein
VNGDDGFFLGFGLALRRRGGTAPARAIVS